MGKDLPIPVTDVDTLGSSNMIPLDAMFLDCGPAPAWEQFLPLVKLQDRDEVRLIIDRINELYLSDIDTCVRTYRLCMYFHFVRLSRVLRRGGSDIASDRAHWTSLHWYKLARNGVVCSCFTHSDVHDVSAEPLTIKDVPPYLID